MRQDQFDSMKKITFIIAVLIGIAFLLVGLMQVFIDTGNDTTKLNLCLFCMCALLGMSVIFFGFALNAYFKRFALLEEKFAEEEPHDQGLE